MIKKLSTALLSLLLAALVIMPADARASDHEKMLGIGGGYTTSSHSGYGKLFFQYSFVPLVRIAPEIGYIFPHNGVSGFEASVDLHFPFRIARGFKFYPLVGITMNNWSFKDADHQTRAGFDIGGGFDLYFTKTLKLSLQSKYSIMKNTDGAYFDLGIGYVF